MNESDVSEQICHKTRSSVSRSALTPMHYSPASGYVSRAFSNNTFTDDNTIQSRCFVTYDEIESRGRLTTNAAVLWGTMGIVKKRHCRKSNLALKTASYAISRHRPQPTFDIDLNELDERSLSSATPTIILRRTLNKFPFLSYYTAFGPEWLWYFRSWFP